MSRLFLLVASSILFALACQKSRDWSKYDYEAGFVQGSGQDILVPKALVDHIEALYREVQIKNGKEAGSTVQRQVFDLKLYIQGETSGVVRQNIRIDIPRAGGIVDLASHLSDRRGFFTLGFELAVAEENVDLSALRVFYLSHARQRQLGDETLGAGCQIWMDITGYFHEQALRSGIWANTTDQRHVSLLAGTYIFTLVAGESLYLSTLTIQDSRYSQLQCSPKALQN